MRREHIVEPNYVSCVIGGRETMCVYGYVIIDTFTGSKHVTIYDDRDEAKRIARIWNESDEYFDRDDDY